MWLLKYLLAMVIPILLICMLAFFEPKTVRPLPEQKIEKIIEEPKIEKPAQDKTWWDIAG